MRVCAPAPPTLHTIIIDKNELSDFPDVFMVENFALLYRHVWL